MSPYSGVPGAHRPGTTRGRGWEGLCWLCWPAAAGEMQTPPGVREDSPLCGRLPDVPGESVSMAWGSSEASRMRLQDWFRIPLLILVLDSSHIQAVGQ